MAGLLTSECFLKLWQHFYKTDSGTGINERFFPIASLLLIRWSSKFCICPEGGQNKQEIEIGGAK